MWLAVNQQSNKRLTNGQQTTNKILRKKEGEEGKRGRREEGKESEKEKQKQEQIHSCRLNEDVQRDPPVQNIKKPSFDFETLKFINIPDPVITKWIEAYPAVDVHAFIRRMESWGASNIEKIRRKKNIIRFLNICLTKEQDKLDGRGMQLQYLSREQQRHEHNRAVLKSCLQEEHDD